MESVKIIVSSKSMANILNRIDLNKDHIKDILIKDNRLTIYSQMRSVTINVESNGNRVIDQDNARWDWLKKLLNQVDEQPIVIEFRTGGLSVRFDY